MSKYKICDDYEFDKDYNCVNKKKQRCPLDLNCERCVLSMLEDILRTIEYEGGKQI